MMLPVLKPLTKVRDNVKFRLRLVVFGRLGKKRAYS